MKSSFTHIKTADGSISRGAKTNKTESRSRTQKLRRKLRIHSHILHSNIFQEHLHQDKVPFFRDAGAQHKIFQVLQYLET